ncbi:alpha-L-rhamnosidase C-terminal domain-containing protein [Amycolatopsis acidiphila]|uniref:alpha-L-rhamnosidase C-terminal domain-containing protein n=1 Tax=Amycolatopsis acidiphila TaxID=715473 RepID=UPI0019B7A54F|nr:hypothetical protein GCM10017788_02860 [Amycolatopsis acidiphila]
MRIAASVSGVCTRWYAHGWGGAGVVGVLEGVLGVTVTGAGGSTVRIAPADAGLDHAVGTQWTERGQVGVDWTRTPHWVNTMVDVPVNVTATIALSVVPGSDYHLAGADVWYLGVQDGRALSRVGSGRSTSMAHQQH